MPSFLVLLAIFLWSSLGVVVRTSGLEIHVLIFYSLAVSVIAQGVILSRKQYRQVVFFNRNLKYPAVLGILLCVNSFTFFYAFNHTTIANAVLTHYTAPVFVAFLAPFLLGEKISRKIVLIILLASVGLWIMLDGFSIQKDQMTGIAAGLLSGVTYAFIIIFLRLHAQKFTPLVLAFFANITIIILLAPFIREFPVHALWSYVFMGIVHSTIAPILYYKGLQKVSANRAAILGYFEPVCAIIMSAVFLHEIPGLHAIAGGMLIIISGYLTLKNATTENAMSV